MALQMSTSASAITDSLGVATTTLCVTASTENLGGLPSADCPIYPVIFYLSAYDTTVGNYSGYSNWVTVTQNIIISNPFRILFFKLAIVPF